MLGPLLHLLFPPLQASLYKLLLLSCASPSSFLTLHNPVGGLVACRPHQIKVLTQFKNEFDTSGCNHNDYSNGVWCDNTTGVITKVQLRACLSGILRPNSSLFKLHHLRYLNLSENNFISSSLPSEFGNLNKLEVLSLSSNGFLSQVPSSFNNLGMLSCLVLSKNDLTGSFPLVRNLTNLSVLELSHNHFSGTLNPNSSLFELHHLRYLNLAFNNFSSSLPSEIGNLNKLEVLSLSSNGFFGQIPPTISNLTCLTELYLDTNELTGSFPLVQNLSKLFLVEISVNHFSGTIPFSLLTMPSLSDLDLTRNQFTGPIEVPNSSLSYSIEHLLLGQNHFDGKILESISKLSNLKELDLSFLNTSDPINLSLFSSLKSLSYLDLSGNSISPASLRSDSDVPLNLGALVLSACGITEFPNILKLLQNLWYINLSDNRINGKIVTP